MLQMLGAVMIILGGIGIGYRYIEKDRQTIHTLEKWESIMNMFVSEISYKKQPISFACDEIGERVGGLEGGMLQSVSERIQERNGQIFLSLWKEECFKYCSRVKLEEEERGLLLNFGILTGFEDEYLQKLMIEEQKEKWKNIRLQKQEKHQERKKLILILSTCMGIMTVLVLW